MREAPPRDEGSDPGDDELEESRGALPLDAEELLWGQGARAT